MGRGPVTAVKPLMTGAQLRACRMRLHLSQAELARRINYSQPLVCNLEHDRREMSYALYIRITDALMDAKIQLEAMRKTLDGLSDE